MRTATPATSPAPISCVVSPGVPSFPELEAFEKSGREVIGELELASRFFTTPIALIGGTNGKSTTTALVGAILDASGKSVFVGGNFGTPLCEVVDQNFDVLVLEISSFQAERVPTLHAHAHALLNITDDHLDRYPSFDAYANAKGNPFVNMTEQDVAIIPYGDAICARQAARGSARTFTYSAHGGRAADVAVDGDRIVHRGAGIEIPREALRLSGVHNLANACAAIGVAAKFDLGAPDGRARLDRARFVDLRRARAPHCSRRRDRWRSLLRRLEGHERRRVGRGPARPHRAEGRLDRGRARQARELRAARRSAPRSRPGPRGPRRSGRSHRRGGGRALVPIERAGVDERSRPDIPRSCPNGRRRVAQSRVLELRHVP